MTVWCPIVMWNFVLFFTASVKYGIFLTSARIRSVL
jgi:hypothetical protein